MHYIIPIRQVIELMKPSFEKAFKCSIDIYDGKTPTIAMLHFDYAGEVGFTIHIFDYAGQPKWEFLAPFEVNTGNMRAAAVSLPRAVELLNILQLM